MARTLAELMPPMTARSVVLSLLLGAPESGLPAREVIRVGAVFGLAPAAMRTALSRLVAAGDLVSAEATYRLGGRHRDRRAAQETQLAPRQVPDGGRWDVAVVVVTGRDAAARAALRATLAGNRYAELREGVWMRPANLADTPRPELAEIYRMPALPGDPAALAGRLWDLDGWADEARLLLDALTGTTSPRERFTAAAATVRHLRADPVLPDSLLPHDWPAAALRRAYADYRARFAELTRPDETEVRA